MKHISVERKTRVKDFSGRAQFGFAVFAVVRFDRINRMLYQLNAVDKGILPGHVSVFGPGSGKESGIKPF